MKYIFCLLFFPLLISCNKEKPEPMITEITKEMLIGDYMGTSGKSNYHHYIIKSGGNYDLRLYDELNKLNTIDYIWGLNIINNKLLIPDQSVSYSLYDSGSNGYITYYYNYNGFGELINSNSTISLTIFKEVVRLNNTISKDTLNIQLIKPEKVSEALIGKYICTTTSQEYVQVEKASNSDSLIITINNANINPVPTKFKIKPPDLENNNGSSITKIDNSTYFTLLTFGKNSLNMEIGYILYSAYTIKHSFKGNKQ
jgi:hypothetical protein